MAGVSSWWRRLQVPISISALPARDLSLLDELIASEQELGFTASEEQTPADEIGESSPLFGQQQEFKPTGPRRSQNALPQPRRVEDSVGLQQSSSKTGLPERSTDRQLRHETRIKPGVGGSGFPKRALPLLHYYESSTDSLREPSPALSPPDTSLRRLDFASSTMRLAYQTFQESAEVIRVVPQLILVTLLSVLVFCLTPRPLLLVGIFTLSGLVITKT
jgi:hypothetical protein